MRRGRKVRAFACEERESRCPPWTTKGAVERPSSSEALTASASSLLGLTLGRLEAPPRRPGRQILSSSFLRGKKAQVSVSSSEAISLAVRGETEQGLATPFCGGG